VTATVPPTGANFIPSHEPCRANHPNGKHQCEKSRGHDGAHVASVEGGATEWSKDWSCANESGVDDKRCSLPSGHVGMHSDGAGLLWGSEDEEPADGAVIKTTVNGEEANVVLDGKSGAPKEPDKQLRLIKGDTNEITRRLRDKSFELDREQYELLSRETAHKEQKAKVGAVQSQLNAIVIELRDASADDAPTVAEPVTAVAAADLDGYTEQVGDAEEVEQDGSWFERKVMRNPDTGLTLPVMTPIDKTPVTPAADETQDEEEGELEAVDPA
jgi:hypothetical protein